MNYYSLNDTIVMYDGVTTCLAVIDSETGETLEVDYDLQGNITETGNTVSVDVEGKIAFNIA